MRFLHAQPDVRAVRVDPTGKKLAVATLGEIDLAAVEARVGEAIAVIEARLAAGGSGTAAVPHGFVLRRVGEATEVARILQHGGVDVALARVRLAGAGSD